VTVKLGRTRGAGLGRDTVRPSASPSSMFLNALRGKGVSRVDMVYTFHTFKASPGRSFSPFLYAAPLP